MQREDKQLSKNTLSEIVKSYIDAYNSFDISHMVSLVSDEIRFKNITNGKVDVDVSGVEEFESLASNSARLFSERRQSVTSFEEYENRVLIGIDYVGTIANDLPNGLKAGEQIKMQGKSEFTFFDGKIIKLVDES